MEIAESAFEEGQAVLPKLTKQQEQFVRYYLLGYSTIEAGKAAGYAAGGLAAPSAATETLANATRALVQTADARGHSITFAHVKSHVGHQFNELADDYAKAGANCLHTSGLPLKLPQQWYQSNSEVAHWAWLLNLSKDQKVALGMPPSKGNKYQ